MSLNIYAWIARYMVKDSNEIDTAVSDAKYLVSRDFMKISMDFRTGINL